jgi:chromosome segregation ATPase
MLADEFQKCIEVLKKYGMESIQNTLDSLTAQRSELDKVRVQRKDTLKKTMHNAKTLNDKHSSTIETLQTNELTPLKETLRTQQKVNIYSKAKQVTIGRITDCNKKIEQTQQSINENELRTQQAAKMLMAIIQQLDTIDGQIEFMNDCMKVNAYIVNTLNRNVGDIADYEVGKLYDGFIKG